MFFNTNVDIKSRAHDVFLEQPLSGTLEDKLLDSQIVYKSLGARESKGLNRIPKIGHLFYCINIRTFTQKCCHSRKIKCCPLGRYWIERSVTYIFVCLSIYSRHIYKERNLTLSLYLKLFRHRCSEIYFNNLIWFEYFNLIG